MFSAMTPFCVAAKATSGMAQTVDKERFAVVAVADCAEG